MSYYGQQPPGYPGGQGYGQPPPPQQPYGQSPYQYPPPAGQPPPGGQYPPAGQYLPPQQYGHHPPPGHSPYPTQSGYPPPQPYGAPPPGPPPGHYGAPPSGYGAPPPGPPPGHGHYGAPPPQPGYGQPSYGQPYAASGPPDPPSIGYVPQSINWDANPDAQALRSAMKGFGTDEDKLISVLSNKDPLQMQAINRAFMSNHKRSLENDIRSETSRWFEKGLVALVQGPLLHDVHMLHDSLDGVGTNELVLNDVLLGRSNADMNAIKSKYREVFHQSLEDKVKGDLSMKTERHFVMVLAAQRAESSAPVIPQAIDQDVKDLYSATEGKVGTDELAVCSILTKRNDNQIRAIAHAYEAKYGIKLAKVIKKEFSGHMQDALLYQLNHAKDKYALYADLLEESMKGAGTKDHLLVSRVVRYHWDRHTMANVRGAYQQHHRTKLSKRIHGETSGDYRKLMLACVGE